MTKNEQNIRDEYNNLIAKLCARLPFINVSASLRDSWDLFYLTKANVTEAQSILARIKILKVSYENSIGKSTEFITPDDIRDAQSRRSENGER